MCPVCTAQHFLLKKYKLVTVVPAGVPIRRRRLCKLYFSFSVCVCELIMLMLSLFCHIAMATVPSRCNGGRVQQSYLFSPSLHPAITLSLPPSHFISALSLPLSLHLLPSSLALSLPSCLPPSVPPAHPPRLFFPSLIGLTLPSSK